MDRRPPYREVTATFDTAGVCWGPYQGFRELLETDPECSPANPLFADIDQPGIGRTLAPGIPLDFSAAARIPPAPAPRLGADTEYVLADILGLPAGEIEGLVDAGGSRVNTSTRTMRFVPHRILRGLSGHGFTHRWHPETLGRDRSELPPSGSFA